MARPADTQQRIAKIERKQKVIREKLNRLDEAFLFERSIDIETYDRHADKLRQELTLAQIERHSSELEERDVEGILGFAERILPSASNLWVQSSVARSRGSSRCSFRRRTIRRKTACWNRYNATGFQLLESDFGREKRNGGPDRDRTGDLLNAIQARSQLRYRPIRTGRALFYPNVERVFCGRPGGTPDLPVPPSPRATPHSGGKGTGVIQAQSTTDCA